MGVMAGTLDLMQRAYPGTEIRDGVLHFRAAAARSGRSRCRSGCSSSARRCSCRSTTTGCSSRSTARVRGGPIRVGVGDEFRELCPGDTETFELSSPVAAGGHESRA